MTKHIVKLCLIIFFFGLSLISFNYLMSFLFEKSNTAIKWFPILNYFAFYTCGLILVLVNHDRKIVVTIVQVIYFIISPFFVLDRGICYKK